MSDNNAGYVFDHGIRERCEIIADFIVKNKCTVRYAAKHFGISKSTIHKDITKNLKNVNFGKYEEVKGIIEINKSERHIRGGLATKIKYLKIKENNRARFTFFAIT